MDYLSDLISDIKALNRSRTLLLSMARRDASARYAGSLLGFVWLYAQPLLTVAAYYVAFDLVFEARTGGLRNYPVGEFLIVGMVPWLGFVDSLVKSMASLVEAGASLQKNPIPPVLMPAKATLSSALVYLPVLLFVSLIYIVVGGVLAWSIILLPILFVFLYLMAFLLGYLLAIFVAALRDVQHVVVFLVSIGMFLSPVLYPIEMLPLGLQWLPWVNPITPYVMAIQGILLEGKWPGLEVWCVAALWLFFISALLNVTIRRSREYLIDWL